MRIVKKWPFILSLLLLSVPTPAPGQSRNSPLVCKNEAFAAWKPLPELTYECPEDIPNESDDRILKRPDRIAAIKDMIAKLKSFTAPEWWATPVGDLNVCALHGQPGRLSAEEREEYTGPEYQVQLMGDSRIRLILIPDPCYQTYYNGANAYLLHRKGAQVYVTEVFDGYFSRLAKSVALKLNRANGEPVITIETTNISGMRPVTSRYYYVINNVTNEAVPKTRSPQGQKRRRGR
jgi:hypothetical protein